MFLQDSYYFYIYLITGKQTMNFKMEFIIHEINEIKIAEFSSESQAINTLDDAMDLIGNASYKGEGKIILHEFQLNPEFFNLKSGLAGDILQKFSNYRMQLAIIGDFENVSSKSLRDFIFESNNQGLVNFVSSLEEAINCLK